MGLQKESQDIDNASFIYYHDLGTQLIESLATLLARTQVSLADIDQVELKSELGSDSTGHKIAEAYIEALKTTL